MKVTVEILDEDAQIIQKWVNTDRQVIQKCGEIEMSVLVQGWVTAVVDYLKEIKLAIDAGVELTTDEVQKIMKEKIANTISNAKKLSTLRKIHSDKEV